MARDDIQPHDIRDGRHGVDLTTLVARTKLDNNFRLLSGFRAKRRPNVCCTYIFFPSRHHFFRVLPGSSTARETFPLWSLYVLLLYDTLFDYAVLSDFHFSSQQVLNRFWIFRIYECCRINEQGGSGISCKKQISMNFFTQDDFAITNVFFILQCEILWFHSVSRKPDIISINMLACVYSSISYDNYIFYNKQLCSNKSEVKLTSTRDQVARISTELAQRVTIPSVNFFLSIRPLVYAQIFNLKNDLWTIHILYTHTHNYDLSKLYLRKFNAIAASWDWLKRATDFLHSGFCYLD